jgi:hypothetical protein
MEALIIHDFLIAVVQKFILIKKKLKSQQRLRVPRNIAVPLYLSSKELGTKVGINAAVAFLWVPLNDAYLK